MLQSFMRVRMSKRSLFKMLGNIFVLNIASVMHVCDVFVFHHTCRWKAEVSMSDRGMAVLILN